MSRKKHKIKKLEYLPNGAIPIVDQSQDFIAGYIDDAEQAYDGDLPIIVFGDHTCTLKYVNFPFAVGADGTQLIRPTEDFNIRYFYTKKIRNKIIHEPTSFDVPSCSTIYLDKPQRNHTLMQTIARANHVYGDKNNGLIVDYIGVFRDLEKALAIYATGADLEGDQKPIADKSELIEKLRATITEITEFCRGIGVDLDEAQTDDAFQNIAQINDAMERILINDETKKEYLQLATNVTKLYKAILPDPDAHEFTKICQLIHIIAQKIRNLTPPADISGVLTEVEAVLDRSIEIPADGYDAEPIDLTSR